jgi:hypothetical protein
MQTQSSEKTKDGWQEYLCCIACTAAQALGRGGRRGPAPALPRELAVFFQGKGSEMF